MIDDILQKQKKSKGEFKTNVEEFEIKFIISRKRCLEVAGIDLKDAELKEDVEFTTGKLSTLTIQKAKPKKKDVRKVQSDLENEYEEQGKMILFTY